MTSLYITLTPREKLCYVLISNDSRSWKPLLNGILGFCVISLLYPIVCSGPGKDIFRESRATGEPSEGHTSNFLHPVLYYYKQLPSSKTSFTIVKPGITSHHNIKSLFFPKLNLIRSPFCTLLMCSFKFTFCVYFCRHSEHWWGFSPACDRKWSVSLLFVCFRIHVQLYCMLVLSAYRFVTMTICCSC